MNTMAHKIDNQIQADIEMASVKSKGLDDGVLAFADGDPENPHNWPTGKKWMVTDVLSGTGFNRIMVSTIMAPALGTIAVELDMSPTEAAMSMSIFLLATAFGPLIIGPLSEVYGRSVVLHGSNIWFLVFNLVCGFAKTKETLIAARFLAGFGASAIYSLGGGILGDLWSAEERGRSLGVYLVIPLLAAAIGPIIGGFIAGSTTWRWMFWSSSAFQAGLILASFCCFHETYGPTVLQRRAKKAGQEVSTGSAIKKVTLAISRPIRMLLFHPVIQINTILTGFNYGVLYVILSSFSELFVKEYGQSVEISGLHYISCSLAQLLASQIGGRFLDRFYRGTEDRLKWAFPGIAGWVGALIFGWVAGRGHWIGVDIGVFVLLFGLQFNSMPLTAYIIDAYPEHTGSALASLQFGRSLMAFLFPLFAPSLYSGLGYGWGNSLMALVGVVVQVPLTWIAWKYGERLRLGRRTE